VLLRQHLWESQVPGLEVREGPPAQLGGWGISVPASPMPLCPRRLFFQGGGCFFLCVSENLTEGLGDNLRDIAPSSLQSVGHKWSVRCQRNCKVSTDDLGRQTHPSSHVPEKEQRQLAAAVEGKVSATQPAVGRSKGVNCSFKERKVKKHQASLPLQR